MICFNAMIFSWHFENRENLTFKGCGDVKKCRYSIDGKCTNEDVACDICNSIEYEMLACAPLQRCIILYDDNWLIEVEESEKEIQNNKSISINDKIIDLIDDLIDTRKATNGNCPHLMDYCPKRKMNITCDDCKKQYYREIRDELIEEFTIK